MGVLLSEDQDVIETLPAEAAEKPLTDGVQVGRLRWDGEDIDARGGRGCREIASELVVVVPDQEARGVPIGRRLAKLLGDPRIGWGASDVDMHDLATAVPNDDEGEDGTEPGVIELQEVAGPDIRRVVTEEGVPRLSRRLARAEGPHVLLDRPLAHAEAELEQFAADPFGSPQGVGAGHRSNQVDDVRAQPAGPVLRLGPSSPEMGEQVTVPAQQGVGLDQMEAVAPRPVHAGQQHQEESILSLEARAGWRRPPKHEDLLAKKRVLGHQLGAGAQGVDGPRRPPVRLPCAPAAAGP